MLVYYALFWNNDFRKCLCSDKKIFFPEKGGKKRFLIE